MRLGWLSGAAFALGLTASVAAGFDSSSSLQFVTFRGQEFLVRVVDPHKDDLRLFWKYSPGVLVHGFAGLETLVNSQGEKLLFAANAGMFEPDCRPVGLLVQNGKETSPINLKDGAGNFYMKPNGVFLIDRNHEAHVIESSEYTTLLSPAVCANQSGPLLVLGGGINPHFNAASKSMKIRSGVGITNDGSILFAISCQPVTFYEFASLFLEKLGCKNALYLDGDISAFYIPGKKDEVSHNFGPMFGLVEKAKSQ